MFQKTTAQDKIAALKSRYRVVQGGTSSSKTFSILPLLIAYAVQTPKAEISVVSESIPHLRRGAIRDFLKIMASIGNDIGTQWNRSSLTYKFSNGSFIEFFSADQPDKLRGARRDVLFVNEANNINWESFHQMAVRTRKFIYIDYNPTQSFWAHTELISQSDTDYVVLTYKDNEALEDTIIKELEKAKGKAFKDVTLPIEQLFHEDNIISSYWANWCKVYLFGEVGSLEGVIFSDWSIIDELPKDAKLIGAGIDFGYTNDPTSCAVAYEYNGVRIWDEAIYETGLLNSDIAKKLAEYGLTKRDAIYADSAEPKSIQEINNLGFSIKPVTKGADSIKYGISIMQENHFQVTARSVNAIKELRAYSWDTDKTGKSLNKPIDNWNHFLDSARYLEMELKLNKRGKMRVRSFG